MRKAEVAALLRAILPLLSRAQDAHLLERRWPRTERLFGLDAVDFLAVVDRDVRELDLLVLAGAAGRSKSASASAAYSFFMWPLG